MTDQERWNRLNSLLEAAIELPADEREQFIARECGDDQELKAELLELIDFDDAKTGGFRSAIDDVVKQAVPGESGEQQTGDRASAGLLGELEAETLKRQHEQTLNKGDLVGQFEIQRLLGSGGMGEVYEALQHEPVQRSVALKVIRHGSQDPNIMARFDSERQTLALMSHPAIATVHDAGYAPDGRPYFAMELVDGIPIDKYVREHDLSLEELLILLISICRGVQHAHQRGVIHRDLKPSNILIIEQDGKPAPKLIDFGIAKAASAVNVENTLLTQAGQLIGTLRYMSPEQADSMGVDVDTRSDVYAVGTIFYELLTGQHPLNTKALASPSVVERQREFQEAEPAAPSRVTDDANETARSSAELRGDLDWILLKALSKDREQRYSSVGDLARDLERHLNNEPVDATPPSASYRWRKFYRRNRAGVLAAGAVSVSIMIGLAFGTVGFIRALAAEQEALQQTAAAEEVSRFLVGLFEASDPNSGSYADITARELLDRGAQELDGRLENQPATKAQLRQTLGKVYEILGLLNESFENRLEAGQLLAGVDEPDPLQYSSVLTDLSVGYRRKGDLDKAHELALEALEILRAANTADGEAESYALNALGIAKIVMGDYEDAEPVLKESLQTVANAAPGSAAHATAAYNLAGLYHFLGRSPEAIPLVQQAIDIRLEVNPDAPRIGDMYDGMGILQLNLGRYDAAEESLQKGLNARRSNLGDDHYLVAQSLQNLAELSYFRGDMEPAVERIARSVATSERTQGEQEPQQAAAQYELLAITSAQTGRLQQAKEAVEKARALRREFTPEDHPDSVLTDHAEAIALLQDGSYEQAVALMENVISHRESDLSLVGMDLQTTLIEAYVLSGREEQALTTCRKVMDATDLQAYPHKRFVNLLGELCGDLSSTRRFAD